MAIRPKLVILDEPVSALDVSVRAQLMNLLVDLQQELRLTYIVVAHDLAVVRHMCNRIAVMYLGRIVEYGDTEAIYDRPLHPYTLGLIKSIPSIDGERADRLYVIEGMVPLLSQIPQGCRFGPRCPYATERCHEEMPELVEQAGTGQKVRCWNLAQVHSGQEVE